MSQPAATSPNVLLNLVLIFLTPMFLWAADGDLILARQAALEALNAYRVRSAIGLVTAAKLVAFELASLASLSQSLADDITPQLALRFRGNANSLDRASERNRQVLEQQRIPAAAEHLTEERAAASVAEAQKRVQQAASSLRAAPQPAAAAPSAVAPAAAAPARPAQAESAAPMPPPRMSDEQRRTAWAQAMASVAAEFTEGLDKLPPAEQAKEMMRIDILTQSASALVAGIAPSAGAPPAAGFAAPVPGVSGIRSPG